MKLQVSHLWTNLYGSWPRGLLDPITSYQVPGCWHSKLYKKGHWDGHCRYMKYVRKGKYYRFPTGFLNRICAALDQEDYPYSLEDEREYLTSERQVDLHGINFAKGKYAYQGDVLDQMLIHGRGIVKVPTGGGKTEIAAAAIKSYGAKTVWLTHRKNLMYQTRKRLATRLQTQVGMYGDGIEDIRDITVAMIQTIQARKSDLFNSYPLFIGDEIHHLESDQWFDALGRMNAPHRFGLTATPNLVGPGLSLLAMTGEIIAEVCPLELMRLGVLATPRIWFVDVDQSQLPAKLPYPTAYSQRIVNNNLRNDKIKEIVVKFASQGKSILLCIRRKIHGEMLADSLSHAGVRTKFIHGSHSQSERDSGLEELQSGEISCVVATNIFNEGQDIPALNVVINAIGGHGGGGEEFGRETLQILGRGTRTPDGKFSFDYIDFADRSQKHLKGATMSRISTLESAGYGPLIKWWRDRPMEE